MPNLLLISTLLGDQLNQALKNSLDHGANIKKLMKGHPHPFLKHLLIPNEQDHGKYMVAPTRELLS